MNSIDQQQPEANQRDLAGTDAVARIKDIVKRAENCFFRTTPGPGGTGGTRPMNVRQVDDAGNLWFLSASNSHKNAELAADPSVELLFQGTTHSEFLHLSGTATISTDKAKIKELWGPTLRTWFTGGVDDPRITVIKVAPAAGHYWSTKHGDTVAFAKMLVGSALGVTLDDSVQGKLDV